jgi:hypothetical protein
MNLRPILFTLSASLVLAACGSEEALPPETPADEAAAGADTGAAAQSPPATPAAPAAANQPAPAAPAAGFGPRRPAQQIGVAACDQFLAFYRQCIAKAPEEARGGMQTALESWQGTWRTLAASPTSHGSLEQTCQAAAENARSQMESYGCDH